MAAPVPSVQLYTGQKMPILGLGTYANLKEGVMYPRVRQAIDAGYRQFDTAWYYGTEPEVGRAVNEKIAEGVVTRQELFITTKLCSCYMEGGRVEEMYRDSLKQLGLDYVDLYLMHWPTGFKEPDNPRAPKTAIKFIPNGISYLETWKAMEALVDKGLVRAIGVCNFNLKQMKTLLSMEGLKHKPAMLQIEVTPYLTNTELVEFCFSHNIALTAYAPLGAPDMIYIAEGTPRLLEMECIQEIAQKHKKSPAQVLLRWGTQRGYVVIPSAGIPAYLTENIQIFDFSLSEEEMQTISALNKNFRINPSSMYKHHPDYPF